MSGGKTGMRAWGAVAATAGGLLLVAAPALAHDSWLAAPGTAGEIPRLFRDPGWENVGAAAAALVFAIAIVYLGRRRKVGPPLVVVSALSGWVPTLVGAVAAFVMLDAALGRTLFSPDLPVPDGILGTWAIAAEICAAILVAVGLFARVGALAMLALFAAAAAWNGAATVNSLVIPGMAFFLLVWGRGRLSLGSVFGRIFYAMDSGHARPVATTAMRILAGATLVALAVGKFLRPDLHFALLDASPDANPYVYVSRVLPFLTRDWYLFLFALIEGVAGIVLAAGAFVRPVASIVLLALLLSPFLYGSAEFVYHLPLEAVMIALIVLGRDKTD